MQKELSSSVCLRIYTVFLRKLLLIFCLSAKQLMCELGNDVMNRVYEANVEKMGIKKPQPGQRYCCVNVLPHSPPRTILNIAVTLFHFN